jgi:hypothetical protein
MARQGRTHIKEYGARDLCDTAPETNHTVPA